MHSPPVEIVKEIYAAFGRREVAAVFQRLSPEVEIMQSTEVPWGGTFRGHAGAQAFFLKLAGAINSTVTVDRMLASGDRVVAIGRTRGKVNATGASYDVPFAHVWDVRDGMVRRAEFYIDHPPMLAALGAKQGAGA